MGKILLILIMGLTPSFCFAETNVNKNFCKTLSEKTKVIMELRQDGVNINRLYENIENVPPDLKEILDNIIIDAYQTRKYSSSTMKDEAVNEFVNRWYLACRKAGFKS
ncbi:hypothetical protein ACG9ZL_20270 [Acinetobacter sp. ULE_I057]|uniref:hypothetical protein n=1 Tax=Acinetobacter sp. ULE_I057 TaxID=3373070 RepID=UPI003AF4C646